MELEVENCYNVKFVSINSGELFLFLKNVFPSACHRSTLESLANGSEILNYLPSSDDVWGFCHIIISYFVALLSFLSISVQLFKILFSRFVQIEQLQLESFVGLCYLVCEH